MTRLVEQFQGYSKQLDSLTGFLVQGRVKHINGLLIEATALGGTVGSICEIRIASGRMVQAEIVGFSNNLVKLMALGNTLGIAPGNPVRLLDSEMIIPVSYELLGRVINGLGQPMDNKGKLPAGFKQPLHSEPPESLSRERISEVFKTGIRAIDGLLTLGRGQRVGIFAGSGVGKSVLLGMLAKHAASAINVIALIGERGREVREFIERDLGTEALKRSVVVVATSDSPPTVRIKAAQMATGIAEFFRSQGEHVLLMMDSLTRVATAQREIGLAIGEPPTTKGFTPSVFALLPELLERAGTAEKGSITGIYTVLVEGDDPDEPVSDAARSILDGHILLSRELATQGHFPAIDVLESISRVKSDVISEGQLNQAGEVLQRLAVYKDAEDLIRIGAYKSGTDPILDQSIKIRPKVLEFLKQKPVEMSAYEETQQQLQRLFEGSRK